MRLFSKHKYALLKKQKPLQNPNRFEFKSDTMLRFSAHLFLLLMITSIVLTGITLRDSLIEKKIDNLTSDLFDYAAKHGFAIEDIVVEGREKTTLNDLTEKLRLDRKDSILNVDLSEIKTKIEDLPWIEKVELRRSYFPNVLQINIKEKDIIALFQTGGHFYPIDKNGQVIDVDYIPTKPLLILVGAGAPEKLPDLLKVTITDPELNARIKAAVLHSGRRWDLIFDDLENGLTVKMPEDNLLPAWKKLIKIDHKYGIFKRKLTIIDLRYKDKVTVRIAD